MVRTPCCNKTGLRKGTWTPEEDSKLKAYVSRYGCWNWRQLPKFAGLSRCGKSCRLRWMNYLRPNIKRGNFSKEEQDIIIKLHQSLGNRWSAIAAQLPGRTDNEIKNHWHTCLKKRLGQASISSQKEETRSSKRSSCVRRREKSSGVDNSSTSQQIFESSSLFFPPPSSVESCSSMTDTAAVNSRSFVEESGVFPLEMQLDETIGSFGGQPFFPDNYESTYDVLEPFLDAGVWSPYSPIITGEEFLCSYGSYDDYNNNVFEYW